MDLKLVISILILNLIAFATAIVDMRTPVGGWKDSYLTPKRVNKRATPRPRPPFANPNRHLGKTEDLTLECLDCICQAATGCSTNVPCKVEGSPQSRTTLCGPFFISYYYWSDAGKPGSNSSNDDFTNFENCVLQRPCADEAVRGYMLRYAKDCDGDDKITCVDFALIHKAGPSGCVKGLVQKSKFGTFFDQCMDNPLPQIDARIKGPGLILPR